MKKIIIIIFTCCMMLSFITGCTTTTGTDVNTNTNTDVITDSNTNVSMDIDINKDAVDSSAKAILLSDGKTETITAGGNYTVSGTLSDGQLVIDSTQKIYLKFDGVNITNSAGPALQIDNAKEVTITLKSGTTNTLTDGGTNDLNAAVFSNDTLIIEGDGKLIVTGNQAHGIESDDDIIINGGDIDITAVTDGIHAKDNITVNSGTINVHDAYEGIESTGDIIINNGDITLMSSDDGLNATTDITINGGMIYIKSDVGDAIDSNGTISIKDGVIIAIGGNQPEAGIDCDQSNLSITGGTLIATGGTNSTPTESSSTQYSVMLSGVLAGTALNITGESGEILTFKSDTAYQSMVFSSSLLEKDKTYSINTGGTISDGSDFHGFYTDSSYSGGTAGDSFTTSNIVTIQGGNARMGGGGMHPNGNAMRPQDKSMTLPYGNMTTKDGSMTPQDGGTLPQDSSQISSEIKDAEIQ